MSLFGMIFGNKATPFYGGFGYIDASVAAYIGMTIATAGLMHLPVTVATYREKSILRRLKITPLSPQAILGAQLVVMLLMTMMGTGLLVILGKAAFHLRFAGNVLSVTAGLILSCLSFFTLGFVLAGLARSARIAQTASMHHLLPDAVPVRRDDPQGSHAEDDPALLGVPAAHTWSSCCEGSGLVTHGAST